MAATFAQFPAKFRFSGALSTRLGETPPVSLLSWSRGGLVNVCIGSYQPLEITEWPLHKAGI